MNSSLVVPYTYITHIRRERAESTIKSNRRWSHTKSGKRENGRNEKRVSSCKYTILKKKKPEIAMSFRFQSIWDRRQQQHSWRCLCCSLNHFFLFGSSLKFVLNDDRKLAQKFSTLSVCVKWQNRKSHLMSCDSAEVEAQQQHQQQ